MVVNPPSFFYGQYNLLVPRFAGKAAPASMLLMAPGTSELSVERLSESSLTIEAKNGFHQGAFDDVYRASSRPIAEGYLVQLSDVRIEVLTVTDDGRPLKVEFTFEPSIDDEAFRWVRYESGRYVPFVPPVVGETTTVEAVPFSLIAPGPSGQTHHLVTPSESFGEGLPQLRECGGCGQTS